MVALPAASSTLTRPAWPTPHKGPRLKPACCKSLGVAAARPCAAGRAGPHHGTASPLPHPAPRALAPLHRHQLIHPYLDLDILYYDLGLPNRCAAWARMRAPSRALALQHTAFHEARAAPRRRPHALAPRPEHDRRVC